MQFFGWKINCTMSLLFGDCSIVFASGAGGMQAHCALCCRQFAPQDNMVQHFRKKRFSFRDLADKVAYCQMLEPGDD